MIEYGTFFEMHCNLTFLHRELYALTLSWNCAFDLQRLPSIRPHWTILSVSVVQVAVTSIRFFSLKKDIISSLSLCPTYPRSLGLYEPSSMASSIIKPEPWVLYKVPKIWERYLIISVQSGYSEIIAGC
jgi:hypothetical protein